MELKKLDFRRSDEYRSIMDNYFDLNGKLVEVGDFVEEKYLKRIRKQLYKEYKFTLRQAKRNYRVAVRGEHKLEHAELNRQKFQRFKTKLFAIFSKFKKKK